MSAAHPHQSLKLTIAAVCEYALESRGRWTLVGTFRQLELPRFPALVARLEVYLLFTDVVHRDVEICGLSIWPAVEPEEFAHASPLFQGTTPVSTPDFPNAMEAVFRLADLVIPSPGRYDVLVEVDGEVFDVISLYVRRGR